MTPIERLRTIQKQRSSLLCVGLDIDPALLPEAVRATPQPVVEFARAIIEATAPYACAFKINLAFFEAQGNDGWAALRAVRALIPSDVLAIADGKRGDIGNTAERYAQALYDDLKFDSATVSPYLGMDSLEPFLKRSDKLTFILALTSNPGSKDFQRLPVRRKPLYEHVVARFCKGTYKHQAGFVVGATHPRELKRLRALAPSSPLLIPGIGAQGGDLKASVLNGCDNQKTLAVINASRSILYASKGADFALAAQAEAVRLTEAMRAVLTTR